MAAINYTDLDLESEFGKNLPEVLKEQFWIPIRENIKTLLKNSTTGNANIEWLNSAPIDKQPRAYQREKVADLPWKQELLVSVIEKVTGKDCVVLNMIHIRIVEKDGEVYYELIDGQQRVTSITDFVNNKFALGNNFMIGDLDLSGLTFKDLQMKGGEYAEIAMGIMKYEIVTTFYKGLSDQDTADLFVYKLNNTIDLNPQEMRNAILGGLSEWIRETARGKTKKKDGIQHPIFETVLNSDGDKTLIHFRLKGNTQKISERMDRDLWLANLTYLALNGWKNGISGQDKVTEFYKNNQADGAKYKKDFIDKKTITSLLNLGLDICKTTPDMYKHKLTSMNLTMMILYARDLKKSHGKINLDLFVTEWFSLAYEWNDTKKKKYEGLFEANGKTPMKPFWDNFGGINSNAINTICNVVDANLSNVGIDIDTRNFTKKQIVDKLIEQGGLDYYTKKLLKLENAVGDHIIARSEGINNGGVTEMHNLAVTSDFNNRTKSNMSAEAFENQMEAIA
jgi:hypothetical protein